MSGHSAGPIVVDQPLADGSGNSTEIARCRLAQLRSGDGVSVPSAAGPIAIFEVEARFLPCRTPVRMRTLRSPTGFSTAMSSSVRSTVVSSISDRVCRCACRRNSRFAASRPVPTANSCTSQHDWYRYVALHDVASGRCGAQAGSSPYKVVA